MFSRITLLLACSAVLGAACGPSGRDDPLVAKLSTLIPQQGEVSEQIARQWQLEAVSGGWNNQEVADSEDVSVREVEDGGRIDGYQVFYQGGPSRNYPLVMTGATLSVYRDDYSAEQALRRGPRWATGRAVDNYEFGDGALAWPMSNVSYNSIDQVPSCPCEVWVRVGRLLGTVSLQFGGPLSFDSQVSSEAVALARSMAARMADAQA